MRQTGIDTTTMRALISIISGLMLVGLTAPVLAQASKVAKLVGKHVDWGTYAYTDKNNKVCYVLTDAKVKKPDGLDHGEIYFTISQKPDKNVSYEPQFITSYEMQESSKVVVTVGDKSFSMFTKGRYAWVENAAEEPRLIAAMKAGSTMKVAAKSKRGNPTSYVFSLKGISAALDSIASCK
jgi:invasion protein IalB